MSTHRVQLVAITFDDGSVGIMQFVLDPRLPDGLALPGWDPEAGQREASDEAIQHEIDKGSWAPRSPVSWRRIEAADVPQDRTYRNAWKDEGHTIGHDMAKAREIHRAHIRRLREPMLAALDVAYQRADEAGDKAAKKRAAERKQLLRDATQHPVIEQAKTVHELKAHLETFGG